MSSRSHDFVSASLSIIYMSGAARRYTLPRHVQRTFPGSCRHHVLSFARFRELCPCDPGHVLFRKTGINGTLRQASLFFNVCDDNFSDHKFKIWRPPSTTNNPRHHPRSHRRSHAQLHSRCPASRPRRPRASPSLHPSLPRSLAPRRPPTSPMPRPPSPSAQACSGARRQRVRPGG